MRSLTLRRPWLALSTVAVLLLGSAVPALADTTTGQVGHYQIADVDGDEIVNCRYNDTGTKLKLDKFVAKAPQAWWPDTDSDNDNQSGTVGWRIRIDQSSSTEGAGPWTATYTSSWVKKTAHEDQPFHDAADAAPFTGRGITWNRSGDKSYRVTYILRWFRRNGTTLGTAKHTIVFYNLTGDANGEFSGFCLNRMNTSPT